MASYGGRRSVTGMEAGDGIAAGSPADLMDIDYSAITRDLLVDDMSEAHILARRATSRLVRRLVVAGREIACNGQLTGINLKEVEDELDLQARQGKSEFRSWTEVTGRLRERLKQFYAAGLHYCS
jgi:cytosine/adenosine deaminase-related metal-dependent hydrolase